MNEAAWHSTAHVLAKGLYNQRNGMALSASVGGYERPVAFRHGVNSVSIKRSTMPGYFASESGFGGPLNTGSAAAAPWITADTVDWWGAHQDAGDWDSILNSHSYGYWLLLDLVERVPAARQTIFRTPKSSAVIGTTYADTDACPILFTKSYGVLIRGDAISGRTVRSMEVCSSGYQQAPRPLVAAVICSTRVGHGAMMPS